MEGRRFTVGKKVRAYRHKVGDNVWQHMSASNPWTAVSTITGIDRSWSRPDDTAYSAVLPDGTIGILFDSEIKSA